LPYDIDTCPLWVDACYDTPKAMSDDQHKALVRLRELREQANAIDYTWGDSEQLKEWSLGVETSLRRLFGAKSRYISEFQGVWWHPQVFDDDTPDSEWQRAFLRGASQSRAIISAAIREAEDYVAPQESIAGTSNRSNGRKVFVVHGHDNEMKETVARFLEHLGLEPVILHEQASQGQTVVEKVEAHSDVIFAVVLLSPDDFGAAAAEVGNLQARARQNVLLELGYFIGRLGRPKVLPIVRSKLELPSDVHGIVYVAYDGDAWKLQLVRELKALHIDIDANKAF
jgi:predicted nucleotide-binding protein